MPAGWGDPMAQSLDSILDPLRRGFRGTVSDIDFLRSLIAADVRDARF